MTRDKKTLVSFDWALKRLLRDKANFDVLEGFVSTLLGRTIIREDGTLDRAEMAQILYGNKVLLERLDVLRQRPAVQTA